MTTDTIAQALRWYADEAASLARHMQDGAHTQAVLASLTVLALDAGNRANAAIASLSAVEPNIAVFPCPAHMSQPYGITFTTQTVQPRHVCPQCEPDWQQKYLATPTPQAGEATAAVVGELLRESVRVPVHENGAIDPPVIAGDEYELASGWQWQDAVRVTYRLDAAPPHQAQGERT